jgi:opacity protein-like surface antigen
VRTLQALALTIVLLTLSVLPAHADGFITPFIGFNFGGDSSNCSKLTNCQDKRLNFGASLGSMGKVFGFEEDISFAKNFFGEVPRADNSVFTAMSNLLFGIGAGPVQPYVLGGLGLMRPHTSLNVANVVTDFEKNSIGYDLGGGMNFYPSRNIGVRGDIRHLHTLQDVPVLGGISGPLISDQKLGFWRASIGLALKF